MKVHIDHTVSPEDCSLFDAQEIATVIGFVAESLEREVHEDPSKFVDFQGEINALSKKLSRTLEKLHHASSDINSQIGTEYVDNKKGK